MSFLESFRGSSPTRQWVIALVGVAGVGALLLVLYFTLLQRPYTVLFSDLRAVDAATIVADLDKKKIPYRLESGGKTILVPKDLADTTRLTEMTEDLPLKGEVGFELFNKSDMGLTEFAQRINYQRALQGELARTIMTMDSVEEARVHLALAEPTIFRDDRRPSKASVTVLPRPGKQIAESTIRGIQRLVAAAVPDLSVEDVVVLNEHGDAVSNDVALASPATPLAQQRQAIEMYYAARARRALASVSPAPATVTVAARTGPTPDSIDGVEGALLDWTPGARGFPLDVTVGMPADADSQLVDKVRSVVGGALGLDAAKGDTLVMSVVAPPEASDEPRGALSDVKGSQAGPGPEKARGVSTLSLVLVAVLAVLLGVAFWLQTLRRAPPRALSAAQRADLANRLRGLLEQEDGNAAPSV